MTEVLLPGVGVRYEFTTGEGERLGIVARRSGAVEFVSYIDDPDVGRPLFRLTRQEADTVAEILGAPGIAERFADLTKEIPGLGAGQVEVTAASPFANRPLATPGPAPAPALPSWRSSAVRRCWLRPVPRR